MQIATMQQFSLFDRFKKKEPKVQISDKKNISTLETLYAPVAGKVKPIIEVSDPVFSQRMMGDGFAVTPTANQIYSPINGKIISIFDTKHAIGIETTSGLEVLIHMGLDTVELNGKPFNVYVNVGDIVTPTTMIAEMDIKAVVEAKKETDVLIVVTNMDEVDDVTLNADGLVVAETPVALVTMKEHKNRK
ncbi:PTS glucose transporter subunit IIA [Enterococcus devriesei]|uniref:PTS sugar transporter subunit IIA n=1 Tax=Enterococcus devriesei TaxID=319970 RepID=UPI0028A883AC|nr:PTS glucose transporter subunit IIA [Enterococcus devriesei]